jgi:hypothetical protein
MDERPILLSREDLSVLIVGYQRPDSIRQILLECSAAGIRRVYVSIDAPKDSSSQAVKRNLEIREICKKSKADFDLLSERYLKANIGCSANLLSACDWVFALEEFVVILEDDCIPSNDLFKFVSESLPIIGVDDETLLVCGTQFVPPDVAGSMPFKSKYSLTWGWATSADKWRYISTEIFSSTEADFPMNLVSTNSESIYWSEGARRALQGYVDVWDTVLVNLLVSRNLFALLPSRNLVTNVGNDEVATHTGKDKNWVNEPIGQFKMQNLGHYSTNATADNWLRDNFYRIKPRHLLTTRITRFIDLIKKPNFPILINRWANARIN